MIPEPHECRIGEGLKLGWAAGLAASKVTWALVCDTNGAILTTMVTRLDEIHVDDPGIDFSRHFKCSKFSC